MPFYFPVIDRAAAVSLPKNVACSKQPTNPELLRDVIGLYHLPLGEEDRLSSGSRNVVLR